MAMLYSLGTSDMLRVTAATSINNVFAGGGSLVWWMNISGFGGSGWGRPFDKASSTAPANGWLMQTRSSNSKLEFAHATTGTLGQWSAPVLTLNVTKHYVMTFNKDSVSNDPIFYFDGAAVAVTESSTPTGSFVSDASQDFTMGNQKNVLNRTLAGWMDDARVYDRILSAKEVETIYAARGRDNIIDGLVGRWLFDEKHHGAAAVGTAYDISDRGNHATTTGTPTYNESEISARREAR